MIVQQLQVERSHCYGKVQELLTSNISIVEMQAPTTYLENLDKQYVCSW